MYRVICNFGQVQIDPFLHVILPLVTLIFLSIGGSFAASRKMKLPMAILVAIIFAAVGDVIAYFLFDVIYNNINYQGMTLAQRFPEGTTYPIIIYSYGFMLMIAFIVGTIYLIYEGKREKTSSDTILDMMTFLIVGSIIGARVIYVLLMWGEEFKPMITDAGETIPGAPWWDITRGGLSIHGGVLGGILAGIIFCKIKKLSFWKMADFTIVALPLGIFFGRIGCYLNGCCHGIQFHEQMNKPWWTKYPVTPVPESASLEQMPFPIDGAFHHPAPLYMAIAMLAVFFWLRHFRNNNARFAGHTFLMFVFVYSIVRFIQEMYRFEISSNVIGSWLTVAQLASIILGLISLAIMLEINRRISIAERLAVEFADGEPVEAESAPVEIVAEEPEEDVIVEDIEEDEDENQQ